MDESDKREDERPPISIWSLTPGQHKAFSILFPVLWVVGMVWSIRGVFFGHGFDLDATIIRLGQFGLSAAVASMMAIQIGGWILKMIMYDWIGNAKRKAMAEGRAEGRTEGRTEAYSEIERELARHKANGSISLSQSELEAILRKVKKG